MLIKEKIIQLFRQKTWDYFITFTYTEKILSIEKQLYIIRKFLGNKLKKTGKDINIDEIMEAHYFVFPC